MMIMINDNEDKVLCFILFLCITGSESYVVSQCGMSGKKMNHYLYWGSPTE